jgi:hypothetical protein
MPFCSQKGRISSSTSGCTSEYGGCSDVTGAISCAIVSSPTSQLLTPIQRTLPSRCSSAMVRQPSSFCAGSSSTGQWIWYRSMASTFSRRRLSSHSLRMESALRLL